MPKLLISNTLIALGGLFSLIVLLMFGGAIWGMIGAVFRFIGHAMLALGWWMVGIFLVVAATGAWMGYVYFGQSGKLSVARLRPPVCMEVVDSNGELEYTCPFKGVRIWKPLGQISPRLRALVIILEDDKFFEHDGLDFDQIVNAIQEDFEQKKLARGASTITQQLAKNLFLTKEKSIIRKASEVPLVMRLEKELSKDQILELYFNTIEWGPGVYGAEAASRLYFDHDAATLTDEEAWLLAVMVPNPKELNLWVAPKAMKSILKRAKGLSIRLYQERHLSRSDAHATYERFVIFVNRWKDQKPTSYRGGRKYPARWTEPKSSLQPELEKRRQSL